MGRYVAKCTLWHVHREDLDQSVLRRSLMRSFSLKCLGSLAIQIAHSEDSDQTVLCRLI